MILRVKKHTNLALWLGVFAFCLLIIWLSQSVAWLSEFPETWTIPTQVWVGAVTDLFVALFKPLFRFFSALLTAPMKWLQALLQALPWPVTIGLFVLTAYKAAGRRLAIFVGLALLYIVIVGLWKPSMNTLALVGVAIPLSAAIGFAIGVLGFRSERANRMIQPTLDFMQTIPTFAYLIPILLLFGFGPIVGLIASIIFAVSPMVRNVILGLQQVPAQILESGAMAGCTPRQRFWWVEVPTALPQIMVGINQTTMAAFSMIIIAAIIGGFEDIGWEVLSTMRKAQFGQSLIAGLVIAFMAMALDRITYAFATNNQGASSEGASLDRKRLAVIALAITISGFLLALIFPPLMEYPKAWIPDIAKPLNQALTNLIINCSNLTVGIKNIFLLYFMVPLRDGLLQAINPTSWGITFSPLLKAIYGLAILCLALFTGFRSSAMLGVLILFGGAFLLFGTTGLPWLCFILVISLLAWQLAGQRVAIFVLLAQLFMLFSNLWSFAMLSVYLCGAAVILCLLVGGGLGVLAAENDRVSALLRPVNDTLQTMPQFVLLIPALMLFKIGEFSALLAIIAYAIVPMIRYTEQGLRTVSETVIEAGHAMGCTRWQMLWQIKIPLAIPIILLGINQTIMYALSMLVIAALVGTTGLGQQIYVALSNADPGQGIVAGLGMAFIAMIADRIVNGWANSRKAALGL